jgi:alpha-galactosidase
MKLVIVVLLSAVSALAADVTGDWLVSQPTSDGNVRKTYFDLRQDGNKITGSIHDSRSDRTIQDGTIDADGKITLTTSGGSGSRPQPKIEGRLATDGLHFMMRRRPNEPAEDVIATKAPAGEGGVPVRIEPPALHKVPYNGLAKTPPMGWNSWNKFAGRVTDADVRGMADAMVSSGMKAAGYIYVNIDDTWEGPRDAKGNITTNNKFPDMKALADYVHSKGLKIGIYSSPGPYTCAGYEGSYGHEEQDAKTWAAWGIDYLKYDWCSAGRIYKEADMHAVYQKMGDALRASGRPIVYSLCQYGRADVWNWGPEVSGNLWRTTGDIRDTWDSMAKIGFDQDRLQAFAALGHWNDPDMLEIGNGGMSANEYRVHMTLWSILASPLLAGNDIREMTAEIKEILTNPDVIAIDQDKDGVQGKRVSQSGEQEIWTKPLTGDAEAIALFNRAAEPATMTVKWPDAGLAKSPAKLRDLWAHKEVSVSGTSYTVEVPAHGVVLLRASR